MVFVPLRAAIALSIQGTALSWDGSIRSPPIPQDHEFNPLPDPKDREFIKVAFRVQGRGIRSEILAIVPKPLAECRARTAEIQGI